MNPDPEAGDGTEPRPESVEERAAREEALWRQIVDNYGEQPRLWAGPEEPTPPDAAPSEVEPPSQFVPPDPPPVPLPAPSRLLAWLGVAGVPVIALVLALVPWTPPTLLIVTLFFWFVGGFGYLVATMRTGDEDGWDDGARL